MLSTKDLFEKIAEVDPETHRLLMEAAPEVQASPFNEEIVADLSGICKKADWGSAIGGAALGVGSAIGAGIASSLATDAYDALKRGLSKTRDYRSMLRENPDLQGHPMGAKAVQGIFSTLHKFNPEFAGDPLVAGTFVRNHLESADAKRIDLGSLGNLVSARKNLGDAKARGLPTGTPQFMQHQKPPLKPMGNKEV